MNKVSGTKYLKKVSWWYNWCMEWESAWKRASKDSEKFRNTKKWYWMVDIFGGGGFFGTICGIIGWKLTPTDASPLAQTLWPTIGTAIGVVGGIIIIFSVVFVWNFFRAPYRQRNEARNKVNELESKIIENDKNHTNKINELTTQLNNTLLVEKQKEHIENIEKTIKIFHSALLDTPKISNALESIEPMLENVCDDPNFNCLRKHLPNVTLWQYYGSWLDKVYEYKDKCEELKNEIESSWNINGTKTTEYFAKPILQKIDGREFSFSLEYGYENTLDDIANQILNINGLHCVSGIEAVNNRMFKDLKGENCNQALLCKIYIDFSNEILGKPVINEVKKLYHEVQQLGWHMCAIVYLSLRTADYAKSQNFCNECPLIAPSISLMSD